MKQRIINWLLRHLLTAITIDEIITNDPKTGQPIIDGKKINQMELKSLHAEAKTMQEMRLWTLMSHTTKHLAEKKIFKDSRTWEDVHCGKMMLYNLSLQQSIIDYFKKLQ